MGLFVISDIHGMYNEFEQLLTYWDKRDKLVLLGDLVDRGPQSLDVVQKAMALQQTYGEHVLFCLGNHDRMFLQFIASPLVQRAFYFPHGGRQTMQSFLSKQPDDAKALNAIEQAYYVQQHFQEELDFLERGKLYDIVGNVLLTHAGFESLSDDVTYSTEEDFLQIRDHYKQPNKTPYVNVFGHTPTRQIHGSDDIWISDDGTYIGIDGGSVFGGQLNAVQLDEEGTLLNTYYVK